MEAITDQEFSELVTYIKSTYGINLEEKKSLVLGRLQNYILQSGFSSFSEYFRHIAADNTGSAGAMLVNKLTTNHTYFMREPQHFEYFEKVVLPHIAKTEATKTKDVRVWSAGCSTGEEPYTLAMAIDAFFGSEKWRWDTKVLATDISTAALEKAKRGVYAAGQVEALPGQWRTRYFERLDGDYQVLSARIRSEIVFRRFNLMNEVFPFKKRFHAIFCRNVMIYFEAGTRRQLIERFYQHTEPGGYLFIGHSESLDRHESKYRFVAPSVYRKE